MERNINIIEAKSLFKENFIGPEDIINTRKYTNFEIANDVPIIPFKMSELIDKSQDYILIWGGGVTIKNNLITLLALRENFGINSFMKSPAFYNQDWYLNEKFAKNNIDNNWYLIKKNVIEDTRGVIPENYNTKIMLPTASLCAYVFFLKWFTNGEVLWKHDYIWCSDVDSNGDSIYVGRYNDINNLNKDGFSIHRHLTINKNYGIVNIL